MTLIASLAVITLLTAIALALLFARVWPGPPKPPAPVFPWFVDMLLLVVVIVTWVAVFIRIWS